MKKYLEQFLSAEQLAAVEEAFKTKNPNAKGLPTYISKERLDEVIGERDTAKTSLAELQKSHDAIPKDWKEQLDAVPKDWKTQLDAAKAEAAAAKQSADIAAKIYGAKGKNPTAIKALIDTTKDIDKELERVQKSDPYLFGEATTPPPKGTGKSDDGGDDKKGGLSDNSMRAALGLPPIEVK